MKSQILSQILGGILEAIQVLTCQKKCPGGRLGPARPRFVLGCEGGTTEGVGRISGWGRWKTGWHLVDGNSRLWREIALEVQKRAYREAPAHLHSGDPAVVSYHEDRHGAFDGFQQLPPVAVSYCAMTLYILLYIVQETANNPRHLAPPRSMPGPKCT